ncbi:hypothetical protein WR25_19545 [Diploscapter pachys]|uniref:Peptidase metallopeptidase domain-containing protein n=1 Tax=Diploscapter pachys TaxID=2018661 RepID=A0A2A2JEQ8_9BILA|nr:hypothetical protein WR25_19545 [Diploscapter pachys]
MISWSFRDPFQLVRSREKRNAVRAILKSSFDQWEKALGGYVLFIEKPDRKFELTTGDKPNNVNIDIYFARGYHGCKEAMDGRGGIVAHSKFPPKGILHLDADERWSIDGKRGVDLRYTLLHEIGHLLGMRHLLRKDAIMNPEYQYGKIMTASNSKLFSSTSETPKLSYFDRRALYRLYQLHKYQ